MSQLQELPIPLWIWAQAKLTRTYVCVQVSNQLERTLSGSGKTSSVPHPSTPRPQPKELSCPSRHSLPRPWQARPPGRSVPSLSRCFSTCLCPGQKQLDCKQGSGSSTELIVALFPSSFSFFTTSIFYRKSFLLQRMTPED